MIKKMSVDELLSKDGNATFERRMTALGFTDFGVEITGRAAHAALEGETVDLVDPQVNFSIPLPKTVAELRTFERALHLKYLHSEDGRTVGTIYTLAESHDSPPIGLMQVETVAPIIENAKLLTAAIPDLLFSPGIDSPVLQDKSFAELIRFAELQREIKAAMGGQTIHVPTTPRVKPGPQARTLEEATKIVEKWREWRSLGYSQEVAAPQIDGCGSRKVLTSCIRQCRDAYGNTFI